MQCLVGWLGGKSHSLWSVERCWLALQGLCGMTDPELLPLGDMQVAYIVRSCCRNSRSESDRGLGGQLHQNQISSGAKIPDPLDHKAETEDNVHSLGAIRDLRV